MYFFLLDMIKTEELVGHQYTCSRNSAEAAETAMEATATPSPSKEAGKKVVDVDTRTSRAVELLYILLSIEPK